MQVSCLSENRESYLSTPMHCGYQLEYGTDTLEIHIDGVEPGQRVLLVDDLLATGGTMEACCHLIERAGATVVGCAFVVELTALGGRKRIAPYETISLITYD